MGSYICKCIDMVPEQWREIIDEDISAFGAAYGENEAQRIHFCLQEIHNLAKKNRVYVYIGEASGRAYFFTQTDAWYIDLLRRDGFDRIILMHRNNHGTKGWHRQRYRFRKIKRAVEYIKKHELAQERINYYRHMDELFRSIA